MLFALYIEYFVSEVLRNKPNLLIYDDQMIQRSTKTSVMWHFHAICTVDNISTCMRVMAARVHSYLRSPPANNHSFHLIYIYTLDFVIFCKHDSQWVYKHQVFGVFTFILSLFRCICICLRVSLIVCQQKRLSIPFTQNSYSYVVKSKHIEAISVGKSIQMLNNSTNCVSIHYACIYSILI